MKEQDKAFQEMLYSGTVKQEQRNTLAEDLARTRNKQLRNFMPV